MSFKDLQTAVNNACNQVFGDDVLYTPVSGSPVTIRGVFSQSYVEVEQVQSLKPTLFISLTDLVDEPRRGDQVTVDTDTYRVLVSQPDFAGGATLILQAV